jgi:hypothetical protein
MSFSGRDAELVLRPSSSATAKPCQLCNNLEFRSPRDYRVWFETSLTDLADSGAQGCNYCQLVREGIQKFQPCWQSSANVRYIAVKGRSVDGDLGLFCEVHLRNGQNSLVLEFFSTGEYFQSNISRKIILNDGQMIPVLGRAFEL